MRITIDIDVTNPEEVVKAHKGELVGLIADVMLSKGKRKKKVEQAVCEEIVRIMKEEFPKGLQQEMVEANVSFNIVEIEDIEEENKL